MDPYFDPLKSSTSVIKDCHGMKCFIKQSYTEGSSWHAYLVSDQLWLGGMGLFILFLFIIFHDFF